MIRRIPTNLIVLVAYLTISFLYFALPLLSHPGRYLLAANQERDPELFVWSFAWWPHALLHGQNPFVTHAIWAPSGVDLAWANTLPVWTRSIGLTGTSRMKVSQPAEM